MGHLVTGQVAAVSVGIVNGLPHLDLDYSEDSTADVDFNVVMTDDDRLIEVQGTAEHGAFTRQQMDGMVDLAAAGIRQLFALQQTAIEAPPGSPPAGEPAPPRSPPPTPGKQREFRRLLAHLPAEIVTPDEIGLAARGGGAASRPTPRTPPPRPMPSRAHRAS